MRYLGTHKKSLTLLVFTLIAISIVFVACESPDPTGPAAQARITLTSTRSYMPADGSTTCEITAYILDRNGLPETDAPIYWSTTCGQLSVATDTISGGYASVTLTAPNYGCTAVVTADAVHAQKSIEIPIYEYGVDLDADPSSIPADGTSTSNMMTYVFDSMGYPIEDGTTVNYTTSMGSLSSSTATTTGGWAYVTLTSATTAGTARVTARVEGATAEAYVNFTSTNVGNLTITASPSSGIPADGASYSVIQAIARRTDGSPAAGAVISFATTWGNLEYYQVTTDSSGIATNRLISNYSTSSASARVSAIAGAISKSVQVYFSGYTGTPQASPTPRPTYTPTPTPTWTATPTMTPTALSTSTPTFTPTNSPTPTMSPVPFI